VTQLGDLTCMFAETEQKFGKIDVLIVNAGGAIAEGIAGKLADVTENHFDKTMNLNLNSVFFTVQKASALKRWCLGRDCRLSCRA
jgi:NAD(P)-dependent dehydrogenase (short-subunit alcohol dehydrogenase family)